MALLAEDVDYDDPDDQRPVTVEDLLVFAGTVGQPERAWRQRAVCRGLNAELFYGDDRRGADSESARKTCGGCPVKVACAFTATVVSLEEFGTWGGLDTRERRRLRKQFLAAKAGLVPTGSSSPSPRSPFVQLNDVDWLTARYVAEGRTTTEIAEELGCAVTTVVQALHRCGIAVRRRGGPMQPQALVGLTSMPTRAYVATTTASSAMCTRARVAVKRQALLKEPGWLRERYIDDEVPVEQIAEEAGCSLRALYRALRAQGIARRAVPSHPALLDDPAWLRDRYVTEGLTAQGIADLVGASRPTVLDALRRHGVAVRPTAAQAAARARVAAPVPPVAVEASVAPTAPLPFTMQAIVDAVNRGMDVEKIAVATRTSVPCIERILDSATR